MGAAPGIANAVHEAWPVAEEVVNIRENPTQHVPLPADAGSLKLGALAGRLAARQGTGRDAMTDHPSADCPTDRELVAVLEGDVSASDRERLLLHLRNCPQCSAAFATRSSHWSLGHIADAHQETGAATNHLRERIAARLPVEHASALDAGDSPVVPRAAPVIPGLVDVQRVGGGGMGIVYRARDTRLDRLVALKFLRGGLLLTDSGRRRAEREAIMLARLAHPNVVTIHGAGDKDGIPYLVMEWVDGPTLRERIREAVVPPREAARMARDLARALEAVHALGIIHRDIKPGNILLAAGVAAGMVVPKLADFGLARPDTAGLDVTRADDVVGTPGFMAPEQTGLDPARGEVGPASDIHGLGGTLFAMLTGRAPYEAATPLASMQRAVLGELAGVDRLVAVAPADLRTIVEKCLHPVPARRYRSAGELADDLTRFLDGLPVLARPISAGEQAAKWMRRQPLVAAALAATVVLAIAMVGGTAYHIARLSRANADITRGRNRAEEALDIAERALQRLTGESIRRMLFRGAGLDEGDRVFLQQVRDEFAGWPLGADPRRALTFRADGLRQVAELFARVGQFDDMLACLEQERTVVDELRLLTPGDVHVTRRLLDLMYQQRHALSRLGRQLDVIASARESLAILESPAEGVVVRPSEIGDTRIQLGSYLIQVGEVGEAAGHVTEGLACLRQARAALPDVQSASQAFVMALYNAALAANNAGWPDQHRQWLEELVAVGEASLQRFPNDGDTLARGVSLGLRDLMNLELNDGGMSEALQFAERRRAFCHMRVPDGDGVTPMHREAADADLMMVAILRKMGDDVAARAVLDEAAPFVERLYAVEPAVWDTVFLQASMLRHRGQLLVDVGDPAGAMPSLNEEIAVLEPWTQSGPQAGLVKELLDEARSLVTQLVIQVAKTTAAAAAD